MLKKLGFLGHFYYICNMEKDKDLAKKLGKFLFEKHTHCDEELDIMYTEKSVLELLKKLGLPEPDWDWYEDKEFLSRNDNL